MFHEGGGLLILHTKSGGAKRIALRNRKTIELETTPESTVYLDAGTGAVLLQ